MSATKNINLRHLDATLHGAFKAACARRGRSMTGITLAFMRDVVKGEAKPGKSVIDFGRLSREQPLPK